MNINRNNYEEFFLLYTDNELNAADRKAVELFVQQNPDVATELQMLHQTIMPVSNDLFTGKNLLLKLTAEENELLLNHIDNELQGKEAVSANELISSNVIAKREWTLLQQTKLPSEKIIFANKQTLYKKQPAKVVGFAKWRAAAILLLLAAGTYFLVSKKTTTGSEVVKTETKKNDTVNSSPSIVKADTKEEKNTENVLQPAVSTTPVIAAGQKEKQNANPLKKESVIPYKSPSPIVTNNDVANNSKDNTPSNNLPTPPLQNINNNGSNNTTASTVTLTNSDASNKVLPAASAQPDKTDESMAKATVYPEPAEEENDTRFFYAKEENIKKSKLGGFLKKIKRTIERKANIKTGNSIKVANIEIASL